MHFSDAMLAARGLPEIAFLDNSNGMAGADSKVVAVKRGEAGCYVVVTACSADELNAQHSVTIAQREAMRMGSMFGWQVPGAYPERWAGLLDFGGGDVKDAERELQGDVQFVKFRCWLRSAPGMWEQYDGHVDVFAVDESEVFERAVRELARTSFKDRPGLSSWRLERIERIKSGSG
jgi:hypothetical protein